MKLDIYQIDAFAEQTFKGNPAAVVPLEKWLPDATMQAIAEENNLAETAFFIPINEGFYIRWFTPSCEIKLCGHATLASAYVLFNQLSYKADAITFDSLSGPLSVSKNGDLLTLDFPSQPPIPCKTPSDLSLGLGLTPSECFFSEDYLVVCETAEELAAIDPNHEYLKKLDYRGVIATAPSKKYDFVVRFFAPKVGIPEDSVTGSAYTQLAPYWARVLGKNKLEAKQTSSRSGKVYCELKNDRVLISGTAVKYLEGCIEIET